MTKETQLIIDHIRKECPELMELSFGCEVELHTDNGRDYGDGAGYMFCEGTIIKESKNWYHVEYELGSGCYPKDIGVQKRQNVITKVIGHPPQLNHLLRVIDKHLHIPLSLAIGRNQRLLVGDSETPLADFVSIDLSFTVTENLEQNEDLRKFLLELFNQTP